MNTLPRLAVPILAGVLVGIGCSSRERLPTPQRTGLLPAATPGDFELYYEIDGHGPDTVVVLHGGPGLSLSSIRGAVAPLSTRWTFILYDQRGRGRSTPVADSTALGLSQDVSDLEAVRAHFGLRTMTVVAHHWGAILAATYAKQHPDRIKRLLLLSPAFPRSSFLFWASTLPKDGTVTRAYYAALRAGEDTAAPFKFCLRYWGFGFSPTEVTDPSVVNRLAGQMCDASPAVLRASPRITHLVASSLHGFDLHDTLAAIVVPTLVVQGRADTASLAAGHAWAEWVRDGRQLVLPGPGLFPWLTSRDEYRSAVESFLGGWWPASAIRPAPEPVARGSDSHRSGP